MGSSINAIFILMHTTKQSLVKNNTNSLWRVGLLFTNGGSEGIRKEQRDGIASLRASQFRCPEAVTIKEVAILRLLSSGGKVET